MLPVQVIWVNMHGFFIFGPLFLLLFIIGECIVRLANPSKKEDPDALEWRDILLVTGGLAALFLVCFINPYGVSGALYPVKALGELSEIFQKKISELKSPFKVCAHVTFKGIFFFKVLLYLGVPMILFTIRKLPFQVRAIIAGLAFFVIIVVSEFRVVSAFAGDTSSDKLVAQLIVLSPVLLGIALPFLCWGYSYLASGKWNTFLVFSLHPYYLVLFSLFAFMAYRFNRNIGFFALLSLAILPPIVSRFLSEAREAVGKWRPDWKNTMSFLVNCAAVFVFLFLAYFIQMVATSEFYYSERSTKRTGFGLSRLAYPNGAVEFVKKNGIHLLPGNMYNNFDTGNFLIWQVYPNKRVFIDGRTEVYQDFYGDIYYTLMAEQPPPSGKLSDTLWFKKMKEYNVNFIVYKHSSNDIGHLPRRVQQSGSPRIQGIGDTRFRLVYFDQTAAVYLRDIPQNRELIKKHAARFDAPPPPVEGADATEIAFYHNFLGRFMINVGQAGMALQQFKEAIESRDLEDFHNGLGASLYSTLPELNNLKKLQGQIKEVRNLIEKEKRKPKPDRRTLDYLSNAQRKMEKNYNPTREKAWKAAQDAIKQMEIAIHMNPGYFEAHNNLHRIYNEFGMLDKMIYHLDQFLKMNYGLEPAERRNIEGRLAYYKKQKIRQMMLIPVAPGSTRADSIDRSNWGFGDMKRRASDMY